MLKHNYVSGIQNQCFHCASTDIEHLIDLGFHEPCDSLPSKDQLNLPLTRYPLNLVMCRTCKLVQINYVVDKEILFHREYPYRSGITNSLVKNLLQTAQAVHKNYPLDQGSLIVDIGSNDGSLLKGFKSLGMSVIGVEPSDIADIANTDGIATLKKFFNEEVSGEIKNIYGSASVVTATNVFAHVADTSSIINGVLNILESDGIFVTESHYLGDLVDKNQYDSIYHEHLKYYSLFTIKFLLDTYGLEVIRVEKIPNYGGSIRVYASRKGSHPVHESVSQILIEEEMSKLNEITTLRNFCNRVTELSLKLNHLIADLTLKGEVVFGIAAPGRAGTLLSFSGLGKNLISKIAEQKTSLKLGKVTPTSHIPIVNESHIINLQPSYVLLLSWHYSDSIIQNLRNAGLKSSIIVPLPEIKIID